MVQLIIIGILVSGAVAYLGRLVYRSMTSKSCTTGCGKCGAIDVEKMVQEASQKKALLNH